MTVIEIESDWQQTGIPCPLCGWMTFSDGQSRPQCSLCLKLLTNEVIWSWLIATHEEKL